MDDIGMEGLTEMLDEMHTTAFEIKAKQRALAIKVESQTSKANSSITRDMSSFVQQLEISCRSKTRAIEAVSSGKQISWVDSIPIVGALISTSSPPLDFQELIKQFNDLASMATKLNSNLNATYREALGTEDDLAKLTAKIQELEEECDGLAELEAELDRTRSTRKEFEEAKEEVEEAIGMFRNVQSMCEEDRKHQKKKARWLWAGTLVTGGLTAPFALYASHSKRSNTRLRDFSRNQVQELETKITECKDLEEALTSKVQALQHANKKLEAIKQSTGEVTRDTRTLTRLVNDQSTQYVCLKEKAMNMSSHTRDLQGRVGMLTYAEGVEEATQVLRGLADEISEAKVKSIVASTWSGAGGQLRLLS